MRIQIFKVAVLLISTLTFASGGNTSGGGDVYGMNEFAIAIQATKKAILESKKEIYTRAQMRKLKKLFGMKLLVGASDAAHFEKDHAVEVAGITQVGSAHSVFSWNERSEHAEMVINKDEWIKAPDRAAQMGLLNHEFCVLTGIEATGDYTTTQKFLIYIRKLIARETSYRSVQFRFTLFKKEVDEKGVSTLGKALVQEEKIVEATTDQNKAIEFRFEREGLRLLGCINKTGYLAFGAGGNEFMESKQTLGEGCEKLTDLLASRSGNEVPFAVSMDPSNFSADGSKTDELLHSPYVLVIQRIRYGAIFDYGTTK